MKRREVITLIGSAVTAWPIVARSQQAVMPVIGFLSSRSSNVDAQLVDAFNRGLAEFGFLEGRNVTIEYRWAHGQYDRLPRLAAELVNKPIAVLVSTGGTVSALAAKASTRAIPVVFTTADDPVKSGLSTASTGRAATSPVSRRHSSKQHRSEIGLLHELLPKATRIAFLVNSTNPAAVTESRELQPAAQSAGLQIEILSASGAREIDDVFEKLKRMRLDALIIAVDPFFFSQAEQLVALAAEQSIPTLYFRREFAVAGGLISYGTNFAEFFRVVGDYAGRILKGAKPADLPVQQPTKFELLINLKTAKALGLTVPPTLLARADDVIE